MTSLAKIQLPPTTVYALALGVVFLVSLRWVVLRSWKKLPYPPGPPEKGWIAGNQSDLPVERMWLTYIEWGKRYGDILHIRTFSHHTIILNSYEDNVELLDKRSLIYSDRPPMPMVDLTGWSSFNAAFMRYGPTWRSHKRVYQQYFKPEVALTYRPVQTKKVQDYLYSLLTSPEDFMHHYRTLSAAIGMSTMYAHDVSPKDDYFVDIAEKAFSKLSESVFLGASLLPVFPFLRFFPTWVPGAGKFKRYGIQASKVVLEMRDVPITTVVKQLKDGLVPNCVAADLLETCKSKEEFDVIAGVCAASFAGGSDTTISCFGTFFQAMLAYPEAQRKAQEEIDLVVGCDRLVTFDDKESLPYVDALVREVMRWRPVGPLSVAHSTSTDDVYKGYYIPKGATIISNVWAIAHNANRYPEPEKFNPGRFFDKSGELNDDDIGYIFGFGRRGCPGKHLAAASVWLAIATVLQNFAIEQKRDSKGEAIPITGEYTDGLVIHPVPFECSITARSAKARNTILRAVGKETS